MSRGRDHVAFDLAPREREDGRQYAGGWPREESEQDGWHGGDERPDAGNEFGDHPDHRQHRRARHAKQAESDARDSADHQREQQLSDHPVAQPDGDIGHYPAGLRLAREREEDDDVVQDLATVDRHVQRHEQHEQDVHRSAEDREQDRRGADQLRECRRIWIVRARWCRQTGR